MFIESLVEEALNWYEKERHLYNRETEEVV